MTRRYENDGLNRRIELSEQAQARLRQAGLCPRPLPAHRMTIAEPAQGGQTGGEEQRKGNRVQPQPMPALHGSTLKASRRRTVKPRAPTSSNPKYARSLLL